MPLVRQLTSALPGRGSYVLRDLRGDVRCGTATGGVVSPVAMGIGVMSVLGAGGHLYGSVAVGIFVSLFGSTRGMIYGPNILTAITMFLVVAEFVDSLAEAATTDILAGFMQIIFGKLSLERHAAYIPASPTSVFFIAFGILLIVNQRLIALGSCKGRLARQPDGLARCGSKCQPGRPLADRHIHPDIDGMSGTVGADFTVAVRCAERGNCGWLVVVQGCFHHWRDSRWLAVLSAIVIPIDRSIIDWRFSLRIHRIYCSNSFVMLLTCVLVLFADLATDVVVGLVVAANADSSRVETLDAATLVSVPLLDRTVPGNGWDEKWDPFQPHTGLVVFPDRVTVAAARELGRVLRPDVRGHQYSTFDFSRTWYIDDSAAVIISEFGLNRHGPECYNHHHRRHGSKRIGTMHSMGLLDEVLEGNYVSDEGEVKRIIRPLLIDELSD